MCLMINTVTTASPCIGTFNNNNNNTFIHESDTIIIRHIYKKYLKNSNHTAKSNKNKKNSKIIHT